MVKAGDLLAGGAVGAAFGPVFDVFREVVEKAFEFNPTLASVKSTVDSLKLLIPEIEGHNNALGGNRAGELEKLKEEMLAGEELINELLEINEWSCLKSSYTEQLVELDESLKRHLEILQVVGVIDVKHTLVVAKDISKDVKEELGLTTDIRKDVKESLVLTKDTSTDVKDGLVLTKDTSTDVKEGLVLTKDTSTNVKEGLVWTKEILDTVVGFDQTLKAGLSSIQERVEHVGNYSDYGISRIGGWFGVPKPPSFTVGLVEHLDELKKKLLEDGVSMVLITGHPGSGKTTLAKSFCQDQKVKDKFKSIFFVDASERPNIEVVQEIFKKKEGIQLCFDSEEIALHRLQELLNNTEQDPVLLVLDNVWRGKESILESFRSQNLETSSYKILVTSRNMLPKFGDDYLEVGKLNDKDAMSLLRHTAGLAGSSFIPEDLQRKVVECCKGLPLVIEVVGRLLSDKDIVTWEDRVEAWSSGCGSSVIRSHEDLPNCLQRSLDALGKENAIIKECFMDLGSFPQGRIISASVLVDMWTVHRWAGDKDRPCIAKLYDLSYLRLANLVITRNNKGEMDDYYGEHFVTQHDLLRELAIHNTDENPIEQRTRLIIDIRENKHPEWWKKHMDQPFEEARLVSISTDSLFKSKWRNIQLPKAKTLVLNVQTNNYELPEFVEKMEKLKVLIVTKYGLLPAEVSNFTFLGSLSKLKRIRLERVSISSITKSHIELKRLQKISFFMCNMGKSCSIKFRQAFPVLQEINIDYCSDLVELPADICLLFNLKKLSITNCHKLSALPENIGDLVNLEVLRLRSCTDLSELPSSVRKLTKLKVLDISNCFSIKELPEHIGGMCCLEKLNMSQCERLKREKLPDSVLDLESLTDVICDDETEELWEPLHFLRKTIQITVVKEEINLDWLQNF